LLLLRLIFNTHICNDYYVRILHFEKNYPGDVLYRITFGLHLHLPNCLLLLVASRRI